MTITEIAQTRGPDCMDLLSAVIAGVSEENPEERVKYPLSQRLRAVELVMGYAYGKPVTAIQLKEIQKGSGKTLESLSTDDLITMIEDGETAE